MRSRSSIFSSRVFGSALVWTVLAVALIEWRAQRALPETHAYHEVDLMLRYLDHGQVPDARTLVLGDSVGRQISHALLEKMDGGAVTLASNAALETPGQYYVLRRYLEGHPAPKRVILIMGGPVDGRLEGAFTENYVQRAFLRWREIAELSLAKRSMSFGLVMAGYKLFPSFRYRLSLQRKIPLLKAPDPTFGWFDLADASSHPEADAPHGVLEMAGSRLHALGRGPSIADAYFRRLARLLEDRKIEWIYLPVPIPESDAPMTAPAGYHGRQMARLRELSGQFPSLRVAENCPVYPDDWFRDGAHLKEERLPAVAKDYSRILAALGFQ